MGFGSPNKPPPERKVRTTVTVLHWALMKSATKAALGWERSPFEIPADIAAEWNAKKAGAAKSGLEC
ncbi:hypothetical protein O9929_07215 [Vibrio lentus]|nr:hypothetical protein [Vibrio lentus]